ncbi:MAG TPA: hypothetical protein VGJ15_10040 [Pirellulales bacterium]|jgi:hypothetical protein
MGRYDGKPFLRLVELYILWTINKLSADDEQRLAAMTPKLSEIFNRQGTWHDILAAEMDFSPELPTQINARWLESKQRAEDFAQRIADELIRED